MVNENLKNELIQKLMNTVYKEEGHEKETIDYLHSLDVSELDQKLGDYYAYDIERKTKNKKIKT
jgi:hypothetical protein